MPLWASIYIVFIFAMCVDSVYEHIKYKERLYFILIDITQDLTAMFMFLGYWYKELIRSIGSVAPFLFMFSLLWFLFAMPHFYKRAIRNLTDKEKWALEPFGRHFPKLYLAGCALLGLPLFVFAGRAAFQ